MAKPAGTKALHEALVGTEPLTDPDMEKAIKLLEALPADRVELVVAVLECVRQVGYAEGYEDGCRDQRTHIQQRGMLPPINEQEPQQNITNLCEGME